MNFPYLFLKILERWKLSLTITNKTIRRHAFKINIQPWGQWMKGIIAADKFVLALMAKRLCRQKKKNLEIKLKNAVKSNTGGALPGRKWFS